jgi:hypothetical protein
MERHIFRILALLIMSICGSAIIAQERAANSDMETQMNWAALNDKVDAASTITSAANIRIEQIVACNKKHKIYSPTSSAADVDGCVTLNNANNIINCAKSGQSFDGTQCVTLVAPAPPPVTCTLQTQYIRFSTNSSRCATTNNAQCPSGWTMIGIMEDTSGDCTIPRTCGRVVCS